MRSKPSSIKKSSRIDIHALRNEFPCLRVRVHGKPLVYLDNAATSLTPRAVVEAMQGYYFDYKANVHRGIHTLSETATEEYEGARHKIAQLINAESPQQIVFTRNATEALNLVAYSWGRSELSAGDELVLTIMEHHSNLVPWQEIAREVDAAIRFVDIDDEGHLQQHQLESLLNSKTKLLAVTHMSNMLGTINPLREIISIAHENGTAVCVDAAQSVPHVQVDVQALDCDFLAFSGHKMYGPTGIGVLYGKKDLLERMPPFNFGGEMIRSVTRDGATWDEVPQKFEAGTPSIAEAVGLATAVDYMQNLGLNRIQSIEAELIEYALDALSAVEGLCIYGPTRARGSAISFNAGEIHPHDLSTFLDQEGIAIRAGHHCTQPLHERLGVTASARISVSFYNTKEEIDLLVTALERAKAFFSR